MQDEPLEAEQLEPEEPAAMATEPLKKGDERGQPTGYEVPPLPPDYKAPRDHMLMAGAVIVVLLLILSLAMVTRFWEEDTERPPAPEPTPFDSVLPIPATTWYHFDGGVDATNATDMWPYLNGSNVPFRANGTYFGIGTHTFEPTLGITSTGSLFMTSHNGLGVGTHIIRSQDQGQTWDDVTPTVQEYNSNDPYLYVDPWTDRLVKFDMHVLATMFFEYSDDEGETWAPPIEVSGKYTPQDHQTIASTWAEPLGLDQVYPTAYVYSINTGLQGGGVGGSYGQNSFDGGLTWNEPQLPHYEVGKSPCSGLSGHLVGSVDGAIYRGQPSCEGPAAYRSLDGGFVWTEHTITPMTTQTHEVGLGTDEAGNVHGFWIGEDNLPYYSFSTDQGDTWREPLMVAPPGVTGTGFPTVEGGADGRVVFAYIGQMGEGAPWSGYMGMITDAYNDEPLITTFAVNDPGDPLDDTGDCGYRRCGGFGDFIDAGIDPAGRPWAAMSHNPTDNTGIVGTFSTGPALRGDLDYVTTVLPEGGPSTL